MIVWRKLSHYYQDDRTIACCLGVAAVVLFCFNLGNVPLRDWDEGTRALVAREIYRTGHWLYPTQFGEPYLLKPPLMDWLMALAYHIGGVNEWTSRLPGAIATAAGVPLLYSLGREIFSGRLAAMLAASVYLTLLPVVRHGRLAMLDGLIMTGLILSLWCLLRSARHQSWGLGFGLGLGIIALTKGLIMLPLGAIALLFVIWDRRWSVFTNPYIWVGLLLGLLPATLWYGAQIGHYGSQFLAVHFQSQGFDRIATTVESHAHPPWFYALEIVKYSLPWLLFLPQSYAFIWQQRQASSGKLILTGSLCYLGLISAMGTKLPWYVMPLYPFMSLALGAYLAEISQHFKRDPVPLHFLLYGLAIAAAGGTVFIAFSDPQWSLLLLALVVAGMFGVAGWYWQHQQATFIPVFIGGMYCTLVLLFVSQSWLWEINEAFPVKPIAAVIQTQTPPAAEIFMGFGYRRPSLEFYGDRPIVSKKFRKPFHRGYWLLESSQYKTRMDKIPPHTVLGEASSIKLIHIAEGKS